MSARTFNWLTHLAPKENLDDHLRPGPGWHRKSQGVYDLRFLASMAVLFICLAGLALTSIMLFKNEQLNNNLVLVHLSLMFVAFIQVLIMLFMTRKYLWIPLTHVRNWALRIRAGNLNARIPRLDEGEISKLARDINMLADNFQVLSSEMDQRVKEQTEELAKTNRSLEVLYDVAATLNMPRDLKSLLKEFMHIIQDAVSAQAVVVRLLNDEGEMELVASLGLSTHIVDMERHRPVDCSVCGQTAQKGEIMEAEGLKECQKKLGEPLLPMPRLTIVSVPLQYRGQTLGIYNLFMEPPGIGGDTDLENLLKTIGHHLGLLIGKAKLDMEARRKIIIEERTMLANELHDSLAQTLASVRLQMRVLDESLQQTGGPKVIRELEQVEATLDEAYLDLRQLIAHCREPSDLEKGLIPSIEKLISRFRQQTGIHVFLQKEWSITNLPAHYEMQVLRIMQEALTNIRKHSNARIVRILLRSDREGNHHLLIENDGDGFDLSDTSESYGDHIGLKIMEERAKHLNGTFKIESEPGEGTRIEVNFNFDSSEPEENQLLNYELEH